MSTPAQNPTLNPNDPFRPHRVTSPALAASVRSLLAVLVAALLLAVPLGALPALAHDTLLSSSPEAEEELEVSPEEITLSYSADIMDVGPQVILTDADEVTHDLGEPVIEGHEVIVEVPAALPAGSYRLAWRVVSSDGHPISGVVPFTIAGDTAEATPAGEAEEPAAVAEPTAEPTAAPTTSAEESASSTGMDPLLRSVLIAAIGAVAALGVLLLVLRRRKRQDQDS